MGGKAKGQGTSIMNYGAVILVLAAIMVVVWQLGILNGGGTAQMCRFPVGNIFCVSGKVIADPANGAKASLEIQNMAPNVIYLKGYGCTMQPNPTDPISETFASGKLVTIGAKETLPVEGADYAICKDENGNNMLDKAGGNFKGKVYIAYCDGNDCESGSGAYNVVSGDLSGKLEAG